VQVTDIDRDCAACEAGLRRGDVITAINNQNISTPQELRQAVQRTGTGREVTLEILRDDRQKEIRIRPEGRSAGGEGMGVFGRLARQIEQLEERIQGRANSNRDRQDRYGRFQGEAQSSRDVQELQRQIQRLEDRLHDIEQNQQSSRQRD
jgi:hypothetical protein